MTILRIEKTLHTQNACENKLHFLYNSSISNVIFLTLKELPLTLVSNSTVYSYLNTSSLF